MAAPGLELAERVADKLRDLAAAGVRLPKTEGEKVVAALTRHLGG